MLSLVFPSQTCYNQLNGSVLMMKGQLQRCAEEAIKPDRLHPAVCWSVWQLAVSKRAFDCPLSEVPTSRTYMQPAVMSFTQQEHTMQQFKKHQTHSSFQTSKSQTLRKDTPDRGSCLWQLSQVPCRPMTTRFTAKKPRLQHADR